MFNVNVRDYKKYEKNYTDELKNIAESYNQVEQNYEEILFLLNQYLKLFPLLNSWRIEVCYQWDVCRISMICAISTFERRVKRRFKTNDYSEKRLWYERIVEYYTENVILRSFSILEKLSHSINLLYNLELKERDTSFANVRNKLKEKYPSEIITKKIIQFESNDKVLKIIRETRHAITHREDPLGYIIKFEDIEVDSPFKVPESNTKNTIKATIPIADPPELNVESFVYITNDFYRILTTFLNDTLKIILEELMKRYENEESEFEE